MTKPRPTNENGNILGRTIAELRMAHPSYQATSTRHSHDLLADAAGLSRITIWNLENGTKDTASLSAIRAVAEALGLKLWQLLEKVNF